MVLIYPYTALLQFLLFIVKKVPFSHVISGLRMLLYFGDKEEVTCVARFLGILAKFGIYDKYLTKGLELYCKKESLSREQREIIYKVVKQVQ